MPTTPCVLCPNDTLTALAIYLQKPLPTVVVWPLWHPYKELPTVGVLSGPMKTPWSLSKRRLVIHSDHIHQTISKFLFWSNYIFIGSYKNVQRGFIYSVPNLSNSPNQNAVWLYNFYQVCSCEKMENRVPNSPFCPELRAFSEHSTLSFKTRTVLGKQRWNGHPKHTQIKLLSKQNFEDYIPTALFFFFFLPLLKFS